MLQSVFAAGISNVAVASVMALLVLAVTRVWKNPHVAHMLWLLVLAKLVTPPLWHISIPVPHVFASFSQSDDISNQNHNEDRSVSSELEVAEPASWEHAPPSLDEHRRIPVDVESYGSVLELAETSRRVHLTVEASTASHEAIGEGSSASDQEAPDRTSWWLAIPALLWIGGSLVWITALSYRLVYFNRLLSQTLPAKGKLKRTAEMIARQLSLRRLPDLRLTEAVVSPMVWPVGYRPMVVLPKQLIDGMDSEQLSAIVAHEFGHLQRGDHWVRSLEFVVVSLYWWNPVVWWVRRELHAAEESCCDALVLRMYSDSAAAYGNALLHTNEFVLSGQVPSPVLASGFGHSCSLKRRVEMILKNEYGKPASRVVRLILAAIAIGILPMAARVALAQTKTPPQIEDASATESDAQPAQTRIRVPVVTSEGNTTVEITQAKPKTASTPNAGDPYRSVTNSERYRDVTNSDPYRSVTNSKSLEQRVDRIESLLKQLIKMQERNDVTGITKTPESDPTSSSSADFAPPRPPGQAGPFRAPAHPPGQADPFRIYRPRMPIGANAAGVIVSERTIKELLTVKAVKELLVKKQAEIERLSKEVGQLQTALKRAEAERVRSLRSRTRN